MNLKNLLTLFLLISFLSVGNSQEILDNIELTMREDNNPGGFGDFIASQGYIAFSVWARPKASYTDVYNLGNTQITVVLPGGIGYYGGGGFAPVTSGSIFVTSVDGGTWANNDVVEGVEEMDYHAIATSGSLMNAGILQANTEYKLFTIYVHGDCVNTLRLFINGTDPNSSEMPGGGDFENNFIHQVSLGNTPDEYDKNYISANPLCLDVLPVKLTSFTAIKSNEQSLLSWTTETEVNNDYFEVEHSFNGKTFSPLGMVDGSGSSNLQRNYGYTHSDPAPGNNYYRLKQVDYDGTATYSDVKLLYFDKDNSDFSIFPNPTAAEIQVRGNSIEEGQSIAVYDVLGRVVLYQVLNANGSIDLSQQNAGIYIVQIKNSNGNTLFQKRILKTN